MWWIASYWMHVAGATLIAWMFVGYIREHYHDEC
jgi:hypothetical protein